MGGGGAYGGQYSILKGCNSQAGGGGGGGGGNPPHPAPIKPCILTSVYCEICFWPCIQREGGGGWIQYHLEIIFWPYKEMGGRISHHLEGVPSIFVADFHDVPFEHLAAKLSMLIISSENCIAVAII